jgi:hypothetical protein
MAGKYISLYFLKAKAAGAVSRLWLVLLRRTGAGVSTYRQILPLRDDCSVRAARMRACGAKPRLMR